LRQEPTFTGAAEKRRSRPKSDLQLHPARQLRTVGVDGFWSITVYNAGGYLKPNQYNAYSVSKMTAKKGAADHEGLELHGAPLSFSTRNPRFSVRIVGSGEHKTVIFVTPFSAGAKNLS